MSDQDVEDWLTAAAVTVEHLPIDILDDACAEARRTCTHHSQIVPKVMAIGQARLEDRQRNARLALLPKSQPALPAPKAPPMTQGDVDKMSPDLVRLGIKAGFLVRDSEGRVRLVDDGEAAR